MVLSQYILLTSGKLNKHQQDPKEYLTVDGGGREKETLYFIGLNETETFDSNKVIKFVE